MKDSKNLRESTEKAVLIDLAKVIQELDSAEKLLERAQQQLPEQVLQKADIKLDEVRRKIDNSANTMVHSAESIDSVSQIFNLRKTQLELNQIVIESWPKGAFIERMTWIATALFPAGGVPFIFTSGEITNSSVLIAIILWVVASSMLLSSLVYLKKYDNEKWAYFEKEFGINRRLLTAKGK